MSRRRWIPTAVALLFPAIAVAFSLLSPPPILTTDNAPTWAALREHIIHSTPTGQRLHREAEQRASGRGPPHIDSTLRIFDTNDTDAVRVTLYRDQAAWCPYCQKVWLYLEEKRVPYRVQKVPMNAYGDKPAWYTRKVDGGRLPAIELDGKICVESLDIMKLLEDSFIKMEPEEDAKLSEELLQLEKELQRDWFSLVFYPVKDEALKKAQSDLLDTLQRVDGVLSQTPGPWFLGGSHPSIIDIQYIVQIERLIVSSLYWKGLIIRDSGRFINIDLWLEAWEDRPAYLATKSDYYTHVMVIPSQNGPGYSIPEAKGIANAIYGLDDAWKWNKKTTSSYSIEPLAPKQLPDGEEGARHEAAYKLISNAEKIIQFCCRGAGEPGRPSFHAELADPYAEPNYDFVDAVNICLRHVTVALLHGIDDGDTTNNVRLDLFGKGGSNELRPDWYEYKDDDGKTYYWDEITGEISYTPPTQQLDTCLMYLRDRVGVPRDMGQAAAMQLRIHLNWAIDILESHT